MKQTLPLLLSLLTFACLGQTEKQFNLGFEMQSDGSELADGWFKWGQYALSIDTLSYSGNKSGKITSSKAGGAFGSIAYRIPARYEGKTIRLEGYMRIKDVEDGFAGLLLRVDGSGGSLAFDNMQGQNITGTKDWEKYSITLDYPDEGEIIFVAGILSGKGEAWFDDFVVSIDGENLTTKKEADLPVYKASLDTEFYAGSNIEFPELTPALINNLDVLGRVWGFLKYYHPEIGAGNYNWDYELFRFLPDYLKATDLAKRDELLLGWIESLGKISLCKECEETNPSAFLQPDMKWLTQFNTNLSSALQEKLRFIYDNRHQGEHYYIAMVPNIGNPEFKNEEAYPDMAYPDEGFRLLALYRYWNMINYFFPYKHLMDKDWNQTLREYIPRFVNANNELAYELAALQIIGDIQDTHANLWRGGDKIKEQRGNYFPAFHVRFIEDQLVVTDYYNPELKEEAGLEIGDVITRINGQKVGEIVKGKTNFYPASNQAARLRDLSTDLLRSNDSEIKISYLRENKEKEMNLPLYPSDSLDIYRWYRRDNKQCYQLLDNNIGYITLQSIKDADIPKIKEDFKDTKGIIIDIRNYPSTFVPFELGSWFVSAPMPFVKFTNGHVNNPGEFTFTEDFVIPNQGETYQGKLIVIVNELSQSQAEYTAMAFRAGDNTTIIGSTTAGADGNVSPIFLPGGMRTMISGIGVYYPNGEETQKVGIVPDIEVSPTVEGIRKGKDELLEKAIELILQE